MLDLSAIRVAVKMRLKTWPMRDDAEIVFAEILGELGATGSCDLTQHGSVWPDMNGVLTAADYWKD